MSFIKILESSEELITEAPKMREVYLKELKSKYMNNKRGFVTYLAQDLKSAYLEAFSEIQKKLKGIKVGARLPSMNVIFDLDNEYSGFISGIEDLYNGTKDMNPDVFYSFCEEKLSDFEFRESFEYWVKSFKV